MSKVSHAIAAFAALSLGLLTTTSAFAGGDGAPQNHFFAGANGVALAVFEIGGPTASAFGGGAFFEFTAIENWLEIEASFHYLLAHGKSELPIDVLLKKPFHVNNWFHPYVGLGGVAVPVLATDTEPLAFHGGVAAVGGAYFWFSQHVGWSAEINDNLLFGGGHVLNEVGGTSGIVFGW